MSTLRVNSVSSLSGNDLTVPPGAVQFFARNTAPNGWIKANGANLSRSTYADLFAAIGTTFGAGNGSTTFTLPDMRGEFPRGWDDGRGIDSGRAFGAFQDGLLPDHTHTGPSHQHTGPSHQHNMPFGWDDSSYYAWLDGSNNPIYGSAVVGGTSRFAFNVSNFAGNQAIRIAFTDSAGSGLTGSSGASATSGSSVTTSSSARPRNISLLVCIKY